MHGLDFWNGLRIRNYPSVRGVTTVARWLVTRRQFRALNYIITSHSHFIARYFRSLFSSRSRDWQRIRSLFLISDNFVHFFFSRTVIDTVIRRNKTPSTGAGIRPVLSGLYYHTEKILDFSSFKSNFQTILTIKYLTEK